MRRRKSSSGLHGATALLRLCLPPGAVRDSILEDLAYEHRRLTERLGPNVAGRWYLRQALSVSGRGVLDRLRGRSWGRANLTRDLGRIPPRRPRFDVLGELAHVGRDVRHGLRQLLRRPLSTLVAVVSLALGIGANSAIFSLVNGLLVRPLNVEEPDELTSVFTARVGEGRDGNTSYLDYLDYKKQNQVFSGLAAYTTAPMALAADAVPVITWGQVVSADYFQVLGVHAALGRTFQPVEGNLQDPHPVVVLAQKTWREAFGSDPGILGKTIRINDYPFTVIGVAPRGFTGLQSVVEPALWAPLSMTGRALPYTPNVGSRFDPWLQLVGRRRPGVTMAEARAGMDVWSSNMAAELPSHRGRAIVLEGLDDGRLGGAEATGQARRLLAVLLGVVGFVLLIACFNVANLELAKATGRRREIALRYSLGASRWRIMRQLLTESTLLALLGGGAGIGVGILSIRGLSMLQAQAEVPIPIPAAMDYRVMAVTLLLALAAGVLFGLAPVLQVLRPHQTEALKEQGPALSRARGARRIQRLLVGGQVALSLALLTGAGLLIRSLSNTLDIDPGFHLRQGLVVPLNMGYGQFGEDEGRALQRKVLERISALPGVESAALAAFVPLGVNHGHHDVSVEGYDPAPDERMLVKRNMVSADYFSTMDVPVLRGRAINDGDTEDAPPVAVVNETMARRYWPGRDAVGGRVRADLGTVYTVVGVVADGKYGSLTEPPEPYLALPMSQAEYVANAALVVRTAG
ncbi:MAG: ADOP family duplicated permease, partial [Gemmatimonadetes bacterium]|nr:ADOP family duplicated permease [Gemmatimonadota bacterium]